MCGFIGIFTPNQEFISYEILNRMIEAINHRGPDEKNNWKNDENNIVKDDYKHD